MQPSNKNSPSICGAPLIQQLLSAIDVGAGKRTRAVRVGLTLGFAFRRCSPASIIRLRRLLSAEFYEKTVTKHRYKEPTRRTGTSHDTVTSRGTVT